MRAGWKTLSRVLGYPVVLAACSAGPIPPVAGMQSSVPTPIATAAHTEGEGGTHAPESRSEADSRATGADPSARFRKSSEPPAPPVSAGAPATGGDGADTLVADEPPYPPGARPRPPGAVAASRDDEIIATWNHGALGAIAAAGTDTKTPHPAPRILVDVLHIAGNLDEAEVRRVVRLKSYWPFRICYERGLLRAQKLHGKLKLQLTVGPSGMPANVHKLSTGLDDQGVVSCVLKAAMGLRLSPPESGTPLVTLEISLWPGDDPVSGRAASSAKGKPRTDPTALVLALRTRWPDVRACYAAGLRRHSGLWGRLAVRLRITANGTIDDVSEIESHFPDSEVTRCVLQAFAEAEAPSLGEELVVVYPLRLGTIPQQGDARH